MKTTVKKFLTSQLMTCQLITAMIYINKITIFRIGDCTSGRRRYFSRRLSDKTLQLALLWHFEILFTGYNRLHRFHPVFRSKLPELRFRWIDCALSKYYEVCTTDRFMMTME